MPFLVSWGTKLAGQAEKGTLALMLSQPVSRTQVLGAQLLSLFVKSGIVATAMIMGIWIPALFVEGAEINTQGWTLVWGFMVLIFTAFAYMTLVFSVLFMSRMRGIWISAAIIAGGYILNVFSRLVDPVEFLQYFSVFYYIGDLTEELRGNEGLFEVGYWCLQLSLLHPDLFPG
ncbi:MAG: ABC-2 family transporter protein [candidate division WS6 bacterium OLB20]|uniref:ABC-2 family transporter protein n=1 Tax=candidate division WS6 bacterium OLB20 TaxID=1617426 RepID=A0A136M0Y4_9BACT|nr:MAG: ABC-2 family transporter protein [candidate division WS6 bacterium OLB20]